MSYDHHLIPPTQVSGSRAVTQSPQDETTVEIRLRTRGPIRRAPGIKDTTSVDTLVASLRHDNGGLPLVAVVFASSFSKPGSAAVFVEALRSSFQLPSDVIWGVELEAAVPFTRATEGPSVLLNATSARDSFLLRNLVADILFFPAELEQEHQLLRNFERRAPFVIFPKGAPLNEQLARTAASVDLGIALIDTSSKAVLAPTLPPLALGEGAPLLVVGEDLRARAARLTVRHDRRSVFRNELLDVKQRYGAADRDIVEIADHCRWPPWAVQMIPARYVELQRDDEAVHAYTWSTLAECFTPNVNKVRELCGGEILEIVSPLDVVRYVEQLSRRIEDNVSGAANAERSFFGAVADAISVTLEELPPDRSSWNVTMKQLSDRLGAL